MTHLVAVYGSLRKGFYNHGLIAGSEYLGDDRLSNLTLYNLGPYPGVKVQNSQGVLVEVYSVTDKTLAELDKLEDFFPDRPQHSQYLRIANASIYGTVWVYIYNRPVESEALIPSGVWR